MLWVARSACQLSDLQAKGWLLAFPFECLLWLGLSAQQGA